MRTQEHAASTMMALAKLTVIAVLLWADEAEITAGDELAEFYRRYERAGDR